MNQCICPFCGENCFTPRQLELHIGAKNMWDRRKGLPLSHGRGNEKVREIKKFLDLPYSVPTRPDGLPALVCPNCRMTDFVCRRCTYEWFIHVALPQIRKEEMERLEKYLNIYSVTAPENSRAATFTPEQFISVFKEKDENKSNDR